MVLVLGHSKCGALKGALDAEKVDTLGLKNLSNLVHHFDDSIKEIIKDGEEKSSANEDLLDRLTLKNIEHTIRDIRKNSPVLSEMEKHGDIIIAGANYNVETGEVDFI